MIEKLKKKFDLIVSIVLFVFLVLFLTSCSQRWCGAHYPQIVSKDSLYVEIIKEIPIYLPGDSILVDVLINCPDQDLVNVETSRLKQQIKILNGRLVSKTQIKPDTVFVHSKEIKIITKEVKVLQPVKYIPKLVKVLAFFGGICSILVIIYLFVKFKF